MSKLHKISSILNELYPNESDNDTLDFSKNMIGGGNDSDGAPGSGETTDHHSECFIVMADSCFNVNPTKIVPFVYGAVHETIKDRIPILFSMSEVTKLVNKFVTFANENGTFHSGSQNVSYPVGGFVVVKYDCSALGSDTVSDAQLFDRDGRRDYTRLQSNYAELVSYEIGGINHGLVNLAAAHKLKIKELSYAHKYAIDPHLRNVLLNSSSNLDEQSLKLLTKAWTTESAVTVEPQMGGNLRSEYLLKKAKYKQLKMEAKMRGLI